jgi:hypothetical protein
MGNRCSPDHLTTSATDVGLTVKFEELLWEHYTGRRNQKEADIHLHIIRIYQQLLGPFKFAQIVSYGAIATKCPGNDEFEEVLLAARPPPFRYPES